jgi:RNA 3'-terminal phosphate cyclase-like protein
LIPDIYIYSDPYKSAESGLSPGYGLSLLSISTTGAMQAFELGYRKGDLETPEEVGRACAAGLLDEVRKGGCVGEWAQGWVLTAMVLGSEDVGRVRLGELTPTSYVALFALTPAFP